MGTGTSSRSSAERGAERGDRERDSHGLPVDTLGHMSSGDAVSYAVKAFKDPSSAFTRDTSKPVRLLVVSAHADQDFYTLFRDKRLANGRPVVVEQVGWRDLMMSTYSDGKAVCTLSKPFKCVRGSIQETRMKRTFQPDFLLIRNVVKAAVGADGDRTNALFGLMVAGLPSVNSLMSVYCMMERPLMVAELVRMNRRFGQKQFPMIATTFYSAHNEMIISPPYPCVVKVGSGCAGFGKMKLDTHCHFNDLKSIVACSGDYCTAEAYIKGSHDLRIQKVGTHYRVFKRTAMSGNWKTNTGTSMIEDMPLLPRYKFWADECAKCFGGMDIVTVDVLVSESDGSEYILEFNGTASGFGHIEDDNKILADFTVDKMSRHFCAYMFEGEEKKEDAVATETEAVVSSALSTETVEATMEEETADLKVEDIGEDKEAVTEAVVSDEVEHVPE